MDEPYFDTISKRGSRTLYRYWTAHARCTSDELVVLEAACDAFETIFDGAICNSKRLNPICAAAVHTRKAVWETGTLMLSQLAQDHPCGRDYLLQMASSNNGHLRLRSFAYLTDDFPRGFCTGLILARVNDKSERVAHAASWMAITLDLTELSSVIRARESFIKHAIRHLEMKMIADLLDQQYHEYYNDNGYNLVLAFPNLFLTAVVWPGCVNEGDLAEFGLEAIASRVRSSGPPLDSRRRAWIWER